MDMAHASNVVATLQAQVKHRRAELHAPCKAVQLGSKPPASPLPKPGGLAGQAD